MPLIQKYLILSAFLASNNPKQTDAEIFTGAIKAKRSRVNAGTDESSNTGSSNSNTVMWREALHWSGF